jgi:hypothetical protein
MLTVVDFQEGVVSRRGLESSRGRYFLLLHCFQLHLVGHTLVVIVVVMVVGVSASSHRQYGDQQDCNPKCEDGTS